LMKYETLGGSPGARTSDGDGSACAPSGCLSARRPGHRWCGCRVCRRNAYACTPREGLAAGGAGVRAVAGMGPHVIRQRARMGESLAAGGACEGQVTGMGLHALCQVAGGRECSGACAREASSRCMPEMLLGTTVVHHALVRLLEVKKDCSPRASHPTIACRKSRRFL